MSFKAKTIRELIGELSQYPDYLPVKVFDGADYCPEETFVGKPRLCNARYWDEGVTELTPKSFVFIPPYHG